MTIEKEETGKGASQKTPRAKEAKAAKATEKETETTEAVDDQASQRKARVERPAVKAKVTGKVRT